MKFVVFILHPNLLIVKQVLLDFSEPRKDTPCKPRDDDVNDSKDVKITPMPAPET